MGTFCLRNPVFTLLISVALLQAVATDCYELCLGLCEGLLPFHSERWPVGVDQPLNVVGVLIVRACLILVRSLSDCHRVDWTCLSISRTFASSLSPPIVAAVDRCGVLLDPSVRKSDIHTYSLPIIEKTCKSHPQSYTEFETHNCYRPRTKSKRWSQSCPNEIWLFVFMSLPF